MDKKTIAYIIFNFISTFFLLAIFSSYQINPAIDTGREFFIPLRMLNGEVLYKDIFNIYGALAYQINAIACSIFGTNVNVIKFWGIINSCLIITFMTLILYEFKSISLKKSALLISVLFFAGIFNFGTFNYVIPYAFAMTYGICFFLMSLFFFIKFSKTNLPYFTYLACFFAGGAVACKYEFTTYLIFLFLYILFCKKISIKNTLISLVFIAIIPIISYGSLFLQGMTFSDLLKTSAIMKIMASTQAIKHLYSNYTGTYFNIKIFGICLIRTLMLFCITLIAFWGLKFTKTDKFLTLIIMLFTVFSILYIGTAAFSLFAIINTVIFFIYIKKISKNKPLFIYMLSSILLSLKTFFAVNIDVYGTYTLPFIIISIILFLHNIDYLKNEELLKSGQKTAFLIVWSLILLCALKNISILNNKNGIIKLKDKNIKSHTEYIFDYIHTYPYISKPINEAVKYINKNTKISDKIVVLPETQFLNFITKRPSDNLYDSLTPMYFETFGEEDIINHFSETKPEYFILNNRDTSDYGKQYICNDYGKQFCVFVKENYKNVATFGEKQYILQVFKRNDLL